MSDQEIKLAEVTFGQSKLLYEAKNKNAIWRASTLFTKEPDTVHWISQIKENEVFVDIGANIGMYSIMAGKAQGAQVFAFEPESQNYALLNRNIVHNQIQGNSIAYCLALTDEQKVDKLYLSGFLLGSSCHTFGENVDYNLKERKSQIAQGCVSNTLDELVDTGVIPQPDHIKIDVDGLEHLVIKGAAKTLKQGNVKSILVELNTHLDEHLQIIGYLADAGFIFDQRQVDLAIRKEGSFEGIGNYIFYKPDSGISFEKLIEREEAATKLEAQKKASEASNNPSSFVIGPAQNITPLEYTMNRLANMEIKHEPYHHFYVDELFPADYYAEMMAMKPSADEVVTIASTGRTNKAYDDRYVMHLQDGIHQVIDPVKRKFWEEYREWFCSQEIMITLIKRFHKEIADAGVTKLNVFPEAMFMRDKAGYSIGPHTDSMHRLITMMVYLPDDVDHRHLGTSVYVPEDSTMNSDGSRHFKFNGFRNVSTADYKPNSAFGFLRSNNSFHGVEPVKDEYDRDTMVYIIKHRNV